MPNKLIGKCPVCATAMEITRLSCPGCRTEISGGFETCSFCKLDEAQEKLIKVFLKVRGNIREVERELGLSYPTIRARLDEVLKALDLFVPPKPGRNRQTGENEAQ